MLVAGGTLIAAWYGGDPESASAVEPILGVTMLICGVASTATAINRWVMAYRELVRRHEVRAQSEPIASSIGASAVPSRVLMPAHVRKVAPLEQH
jgi:uncharacterized membrane protein YidH (DUF202 family)